MLNDLGLTKGKKRGRGITFGSSPTVDASHLQGIPFLSGEQDKRRFTLDVSALPKFSEPFVKSGAKLILSLPALAISRAPYQRKTCSAIVEKSEDSAMLVIDQSYYGISFDKEYEWLAHRINAILNTDFALYWTFMTGTDMGVGIRNLIEMSDWDGIPMPSDILVSDSVLWKEVDRLERSIVNFHSDRNATAELEESLNKAVLRLYSLSDQDSLQIRETARYSIASLLSRSSASAIEPPTSSLLSDYSRRVCMQLNDVLRYAETQVSATVFVFPASTPLRACRFALGPVTRETSVEEIELPGVEELLAQISGHLRDQIADNLFIQRDLRVYDGATLWIIKPLEDRLWTESAALHDADSIVGEHLGQGR